MAKSTKTKPETSAQNADNGVKKKSKGKTALKVIAIILAVIIGVGGIGTIITLVSSSANIKLARSYGKVSYDNQLVPELDEDGDWTFTTDKDFKIVQLTDVHIGGGNMSGRKDASAITAVATMLAAEKPDLVVVTGDIAYPVPFQAGTFNNKTGAKTFAELMEALGVYWTLGFGNHDTEAYSYYSREDIAKFYSSDKYPHCIFVDGPADVDGSGNQVIKVKNSDGVITQALFVLDSHSYIDGDIFGIKWKYDNIHENQIDWYKTRVAQLNAENSNAIASAKSSNPDKDYSSVANVKSLAFFHIPLTEYKDAWTEFENNGYKDNDEVQYHGGLLGETGDRAIYCGIHEDNLFETMLELGSTKGVFCGHDHLNNFSLNYKGIELSYGYSVDYLAYVGINKRGSQRGCTTITVKPDGTFAIEKNNLYTSGKYDIPAGFADDITMQFEGVSYRYTEPEK